MTTPFTVWKPTPDERHNLIDVPVCRQQIEAMQLSLVEAFARETTEGKDGAT